MSNYTKTTDFAAKDGLASGNPAKVIKGTEHDTEYNNIATAVNSKSDSASPVFTGVATGVVNNFAGSRGLIGKVNGASPLTKYDLSADAVILKNSSNDTIVRTTVTTITNDLGLAGITANGRDQVAVFAVSSWIHVYFIWNGTTLATVSSLTAPPTGPIMPTGYTHWCYAAALRWNASSNIIPCRTQSNFMWYDVGQGGINRMLTNGQATTRTAVDLSGIVSPNVVLVQLNLNLDVIHNTASIAFAGALGPTGSSTTQEYVKIDTQVNGQECAQHSQLSIPAGTTQQIDYNINLVPSGSGGLTVDVLGFTIPNGAI